MAGVLFTKNLLSEETYTFSDAASVTSAVIKNNEGSSGNISLKGKGSMTINGTLVQCEAVDILPNESIEFKSGTAIISFTLTVPAGTSGKFIAIL